MKNPFKKKFATKISYFGEGYFTIKYSEYRLFPIWYSLYDWFEYSIPNSVTGWSVKLAKREKAEKLAKQINSLEDVRKYYEPLELKEEDYNKREQEYYNSLDTKTTIYKK